MKRIDEPDVLRFFLEQEGGDSNIKTYISSDRFSTELLETLNEELARIILEDARNSEVAAAANHDQDYSDITWSEERLSGRALRKSILWRGQNDNEIHTFVVFNFRESFFESGAPLLGLCIILFIPLNPLLAVPATVQIWRTLFKKLQILRRPKDADAIDTLNAVLAIRCKHAYEDQGRLPTTRELAEYRCLRIDEIVPALERLVTLEVIKCEVWGDQAGDVSHMSNAWRIPL